MRVGPVREEESGHKAGLPATTSNTIGIARMVRLGDAWMTTGEVRPVPPFDEETAGQKVKAAQDAWNTRVLQRNSQISSS